MTAPAAPRKARRPVDRVRRKLDKSRRWLGRIDGPLARLRLKRWGLLPLLDSAFARNAPDGAIAPSYGELCDLYRATIERRPHVVFEFGSGYSTLILAEALWRNGRRGHPGYLFSLDGSALWAERTRRVLRPKHASVCEVRECRVQPCQVGGENACVHDDLPSATPDMAFLDGPGGIAEIEGAADLLFLQHELPRDFLLIVDGRKRNMRFLMRHLERAYAYSESRGFLGRSFRLRHLRLTDEPTLPARQPQSPVDSAEKTS